MRSILRSAEGIAAVYQAVCWNVDEWVRVSIRRSIVDRLKDNEDGSDAQTQDHEASRDPGRESQRMAGMWKSFLLYVT